MVVSGSEHTLQERLQSRVCLASRYAIAAEAAPTGEVGRCESAQLVQRLGEAVRMRALRLGQGLEPVGDFLEAFLARGLGHARVHVGVLVGLARDRALQVGVGFAERQAGGGVAALFEVFEMAVSVAGLAFGGGAEHGGNVVVTLHVRLGGEVEVTAVGHGFAGKRVFQTLLGLRAFQLAHDITSWRWAGRAMRSGLGAWAAETQAAVAAPFWASFAPALDPWNRHGSASRRETCLKTTVPRSLGFYRPHSSGRDTPSLAPRRASLKLIVLIRTIVAGYRDAASRVRSRRRGARLRRAGRAGPPAVPGTRRRAA